MINIYINLSGKDISSDGGFLNVLFSADRKSKYDSAREYIQKESKVLYD
jgi:hypothetical protein